MVYKLRKEPLELTSGSTLFCMYGTYVVDEPAQFCYLFTLHWMNVKFISTLEGYDLFKFMRTWCSDTPGKYMNYADFKYWYRRWANAAKYRMKELSDR
jgi:hypothetical protein